MTADQLAIAQRLRDGLRAAAVLNAGVVADEAALGMGEEALARVPVQVSVLGPEPLVAIERAGGGAVLGEVAVAVAVARLSDRWPRVKACAGEDCGYVFWDGTRNASRRWCDMQRCGSRQKMRNYRARTGARHPARQDTGANGHHRAGRTT